MKDGYVDSHYKLCDRPHHVMFFSTVQPDFKQLSLRKWDLCKPSSKQELDRYVVVCKNDGESDTETEVESESESEEEQVYIRVDDIWDLMY